MELETCESRCLHAIEVRAFPQRTTLNEVRIREPFCREQNKAFVVATVCLRLSPLSTHATLPPALKARRIAHACALGSSKAYQVSLETHLQTGLPWNDPQTLTADPGRSPRRAQRNHGVAAEVRRRPPPNLLNSGYLHQHHPLVHPFGRPTPQPAPIVYSPQPTQQVE